MTHTVRSIDALINSIPEAQPINPANAKIAENAPVEQKVEQKSPSGEPDFTEEAQDLTENTPEITKNTPDDAEKLQKTPENTEKTENKAVDSPDTDEYGNPVVKKQKMYTEEEVQQKIRDRLRRVKEQPVQQTQQQQLQDAQDAGFEYNENSELTWAQQLENFVENTMVKVGQRHQRKQEEAVQKAAQVEFESKFQSGMEKYPDFVETLQDKHVDNAMMMGIQGLNNPAAFLYTVAKKAPKELERIAKIPNPYARAAEMGALHAKLSKPKNSTNAPKPLSQDRGDLTEKPAAKVSIDHLIAEDAKKRYSR